MQAILRRLAEKEKEKSELSRLEIPKAVQSSESNRSVLSEKLIEKIREKEERLKKI